MIPERFRNRAFVQVIQAFLMVDWIVISVISLGTYFISVLKPHYQEFSLADPDLMYTHVSRDAIPFWLLSVLCFLVPAILITLTALMNAPVVDLNRGLLGLGLSVSFCAMIIESLKIFVGRPRPDFLSRCQPPIGAIDPPFGLSNYTICTTSPMDNDGFKSFPSGHASYSFSGWVYLSLFFAKHIHLFNQKEGVRTIKSIVFWTPLVGAVFMCATRFVENRHHFTDLLIGGIIGATCGVFGYLQYHSSLFEYDKQNSHRLSRSSDLFQQDEESQNVHRHRDDPERTLSPGPSRSSEV